MSLMIEDVLESLVEQGGSDVHIQARAPIFFRINGQLTAQTQFGESYRKSSSGSKRSSG